jgi:hypothetical protein
VPNFVTSHPHCLAGDCYECVPGTAALKLSWTPSGSRPMRRSEDGYEWVEMCDTKTSHKIIVNTIVVILINGSQVPQFKILRDT